MADIMALICLQDQIAADIFTEEMNTILCNLPGVNIIMNDILSYKATIQEYKSRLEAVLKWVSDVNLKLSPRKYKICKSHVILCGAYPDARKFGTQWRARSQIATQITMFARQ